MKIFMNCIINDISCPKNKNNLEKNNEVGYFWRLLGY